MARFSRVPVSSPAAPKPPSDHEGDHRIHPNPSCFACTSAQYIGWPPFCLPPHLPLRAPRRPRTHVVLAPRVHEEPRPEHEAERDQAWLPWGKGEAREPPRPRGDETDGKRDAEPGKAATALLEIRLDGFLRQHEGWLLRYGEHVYRCGATRRPCHRHPCRGGGSRRTAGCRHESG